MQNSKNKIKKILTGIGILVVAVISINVIATKLRLRLDVTEGKIYSLSDGSRSILGKISEPIEIQLYFSRSSKALPPIFKTYGTRVEEVLREYVGASGGKLSLNIYDPMPDTDEEEWARKYGINPLDTGKNETIFFGAVFLKGRSEIAIPYFDPRREEFLEYDISEALVQIQNTEKKTIGVMSSLKVLGGGGSSFQGEQSQGWVLFDQLKKSYIIKPVETTADKIDQDINILFVMHPKDLSDATSYAIDQFVLRGGRLIVAVDPFSRIDLATAGQMAQMSGQMPQTSSNLKKLFDHWGIQYDPTQILGDLQGMPQIQVQSGAISYPYFVNIRQEGMSPDSQIASKLNHVMIAEGGGLSLKEGSSLTLELLLKSSKQSGFANAMMAGFMQPEEFAKQLKPDGVEHAVSGLLQGKFTTAFPEGITNAESGSNDTSGLKESAEDNMVLIIADTDFMHEQNAVDQMRFGPQVILRPRNDNFAFVMNALDLMSGSGDLISIRSRGKITRPFTKVEQLQVAAQQRWQEEEERLSSRLQDLEKKLSELQSNRASGSVLSLTSAQQLEITKFRDEEAQVRKQRREVRRKLREDIESLGRSLIALNLTLVPLAVAAFGLWIFSRRTYRRKRGEN